MKNCKRLLVFSNTCFNKKESNGRTLMNMLQHFDSDSIAQFYIHGNPDMEFCKHYYNVSDKQALKAFLNLKKNDISGRANKSAGNEDSEATKKKQNCRKRYLRNVIWKSNRWWNKSFDDFLNNFQPDAILISAADAPFLISLARKVAKKYSLPIYYYTTENYVLKDVMYRSASKKDIFHNLLKRSLKSETKKVMNEASGWIFHNDYLEEIFKQSYPQIKDALKCYVGTNLEDCTKFTKVNDVFSLVYCGNFGLGRVDVLCSFSKILKKVDSKAIFNIYGQFDSVEDEKKVTSFDNVRYHGFVEYREIPRVFGENDIVFHCENIKNLKNLMAVFSTKIADSLSCGKPFLVYASRKFPFVQYLMKYNSVHIAENEQELYDVLLKCKESIEYRNQYIENAKNLAKMNHNAEVNAKKVFDMINREG